MFDIPLSGRRRSRAADVRPGGMRVCGMLFTEGKINSDVCVAMRSYCRGFRLTVGLLLA